MAFEGGGTDVRKNLMKPDTDGIEIGFPDRILALLVLFAALLVPFAGHEVHIYFIFRQRTCHQFAIRGQDISPVGLHRYILFYEAVGYIVPVLSLGKHNHGAFHNNSYPHQPHE